MRAYRQVFRTSPSTSVFTDTVMTMASMILTVNTTESIFENFSVGDDPRTAEEEDEEYTPYEQRPETYIVPVVSVFILLIGLTGNGVLALTILRHASMRNVPNTYVLSLALGDLFVIMICVPFTFTMYILDSWPFGLLLCKIFECAKDISIGVSVFTLTALSADRFFAIVDPMRKLHTTGIGRRATRFTATIAALIWFLAILCAIPATFSYLKVFRANQNVTFQACYPFPEEFGPNYPLTIVVCRFFIYYAIPLSIIAVFYLLMARHLMRSTKNIPGEMQGQARQVKARKKVAKMVMAFVIVFAICFFPQHVFMLWFYIHPTAQEDYNAFWHYFRILGYCLAFTNSCINPIALYCVSGTFRKYFDRYLLCFCPSWIGKSRRRARHPSEMSPRGRGHSFSMASSRKFISDSRRAQNVIHMSSLAGDGKSNVSKEQETVITLSNNNGVDELSTRTRKILSELSIHPNNNRPL